MERARQPLRCLCHTPHPTQTGSSAHGPDTGQLGFVPHLFAHCPDWTIWITGTVRSRRSVWGWISGLASTFPTLVFFTCCRCRHSAFPTNESVAVPEPQSDPHAQPEPRTTQRQPREPLCGANVQLCCDKLTDPGLRAPAGVQAQLPGARRRRRGQKERISLSGKT